MIPASQSLSNLIIYQLVCKAGYKNTFQLESEGVYYTLKVAGVNEVLITEQVKEPALKFTDGSEWVEVEVDWNE